jgi:hypothetical protein
MSVFSQKLKNRSKSKKFALNQAEHFPFRVTNIPLALQGSWLSPAGLPGGNLPFNGPIPN